MLKKLGLLFLCIFCFSVFIYADPPSKITVQAVLSKRNNQELYSGTYNIQIGLFPEESEVALWSYLYEDVYFDNGYFAVDLGENGLALDIDAFEEEGLRLGITIFDASIDDNTVYVPIVAVPYAIKSIRSETAERIFDENIIYISTANRSVHIGTGIVTPSAELEVSGTVKADYYIGDGSGLTNVAANVFNALNAPGGGTRNVVFVSSNAYVSIGHVTPNEELDIEGNVLMKGTFGSGELLNTTGAGTRFIWYPRKAALRAGIVVGDIWDDSNIGDYSIAFGSENKASGIKSVVSGGENNQATGEGSVVSGGKQNVASGERSVVSGGEANQAIEQYAVVPGGANNYASGIYSFAAGFKARAVHTGSFVWADSQDAFFESLEPNQFLIRAAGGVGIGTSNPTEELEVSGTVKAGAFIGDGSGLTGILAADSNWTQTGADIYFTLGDVGISTTNPVYKLDVNGTVRATTYLGDGSQLSNLPIPTTYWYENPSHHLYYTSGNIGIGTTDPSESLHVIGTVKANFFVGDGSGLTGVSANYAALAGSVTWNNIIDIPAGFQDGVDDNTTYNAGQGLELLGTQFKLTSQNALSNQVLQWSGTGWEPEYITATLTGALTASENLADLHSTVDARANLDLEPGVDIMAYDQDLQEIATLTPTNNQILRYVSGAWITTENYTDLAGTANYALAADSALTANYAVDVYNDSITSIKIVDGVISEPDMATSAVTSRVIVNGTIINDDVAAGAGIELSKLESGTSGYTIRAGSDGRAVYTSEIFVSENSNIGLGTTNVSARLNVGGNIYASSQISGSEIFTEFYFKSRTYTQAYLQWVSDNVLDFYVGNKQYMRLDAAGNLIINESGDSANGLRVESDTNANMLYVDAANNRVGIGTSNPIVELGIEGDVKVAGTVTANSFYGAFYGNASGLTSVPIGNSMVDGDQDTKVEVEAVTNNNMVLFTAAGTEVAYMDSTKLAVSGNIFASDTVSANVVRGTSLYGDLYGDGTNITKLSVSAYWGETGSDIFYSSGNVGIGTSNPVADLAVSGDIYITSTFNATSSIVYTQYFEQASITGSGALSIDWNDASKHKLNIDGASVTLTFVDPPKAANLALIIYHQAADISITWPAAVKWPRGVEPVLSTPNGSIDVISIYYDGTNYLGVGTIEFK